MCILYIFTFWETEQTESPFFTIQENSHSCFITVPSLIMGLWKYIQKEMNMWNEKGEMNVSCSDISAILVQMSARLSSPDKATELSNCFLLLLPWWQEGIEEVNQRLISLGNRCHCFSHALLLCAEIAHIHKWFVKCFKGKRKKVKVWIVMCTLLKHLQLLCLAACRVQRFLLNLKKQPFFFSMWHIFKVYLIMFERILYTQESQHFSNHCRPFNPFSGSKLIN